jgi:hypothetical protein
MTLEITPVRGVAAHYGPREIDNSHGGQESTKMGVTKTAEWDFTFDNLPEVLDSNLPQVIPAKASIIGATLFVDDTWTGATAMNVGLSKKDGTVVDADGLIAAADDLDEGDVTEASAEALIGGSVGADPVQLTVAVTGTATAGKARVVVQYKYDK